MKTSTGFEIELDPKRLDNMELLEILPKLSHVTEDSVLEDMTLLSKFFVVLFGEDAKTRLYDHIRTDDGRVPMSEFGRELTEIFQTLMQNPLKK